MGQVPLYVILHALDLHVEPEAISQVTWLSGRAGEWVTTPLARRVR